MKKVLTILVTVILLGSGMQVSIDRHYCGGTLAGVKVSMTGRMASCGMEESESGSIYYAVIDKSCCEDQVFFYSISNNYYPEYFETNLFAPASNITPITANNINSNNIPNLHTVRWVLPPGYNFRSELSQSDLCIFRI